MTPAHEWRSASPNPVETITEIIEVDLSRYVFG
jgi:hypothetical protein